MQNLIIELGVPNVKTSNTPLFINNKATLKLSRNPEYYDRTKHIAIKYYFLRKATLAKRVNTIYVASRDNLANIFTKAVPRETLNRLKTAMGLTT